MNWWVLSRTSRQERTYSGTGSHCDQLGFPLILTSTVVNWQMAMSETLERPLRCSDRDSACGSAKNDANRRVTLAPPT